MKNPRYKIYNPPSDVTDVQYKHSYKANSNVMSDRTMYVQLDSLFTVVRQFDK